MMKRNRNFMMPSLLEQRYFFLDGIWNAIWTHQKSSRLLRKISVSTHLQLIAIFLRMVRIFSIRFHNEEDLWVLNDCFLTDCLFQYLHMEKFNPNQSLSLRILSIKDDLYSRKKIQVINIISICLTLSLTFPTYEAKQQKTYHYWKNTNFPYQRSSEVAFHWLWETKSKPRLYLLKIRER